MTARPKICIDRILPRDLMRLQPTTRGGGRTRAIAPIREDLDERIHAAGPVYRRHGHPEGHRA